MAPVVSLFTRIVSASVAVETRDVHRKKPGDSESRRKSKRCPNLSRWWRPCRSVETFQPSGADPRRDVVLFGGRTIRVCWFCINLARVPNALRISVPPLPLPTRSPELTQQTWPSGGLEYLGKGRAVQRRSHRRKVSPANGIHSESVYSAGSCGCSPDSDDGALECGAVPVQCSGARRNAVEQKHCSCREKWGGGGAVWFHSPRNKQCVCQGRNITVGFLRCSLYLNQLRSCYSRSNNSLIFLQVWFCQINFGSCLRTRSAWPPRSVSLCLTCCSCQTDPEKPRRRKELEIEMTEKTTVQCSGRPRIWNAARLCLCSAQLSNKQPPRQRVFKRHHCAKTVCSFSGRPERTRENVNGFLMTNQSETSKQS